MPEFRYDAEPDWPEEFREYRESDGWKSEFDWEVARVRWARSRGFKQFKILPLIQRMTGSATGECSKSEEKRRES